MNAQHYLLFGGRNPKPREMHDDDAASDKVPGPACHYCWRTHAAVPEFANMKLTALVVYLAEDEKKSDEFMSYRKAAISIFAAGGERLINLKPAEKVVVSDEVMDKMSNKGKCYTKEAWDRETRDNPALLKTKSCCGRN